MTGYVTANPLPCSMQAIAYWWHKESHYPLFCWTPGVQSLASNLFPLSPPDKLSPKETYATEPVTGRESFGRPFVLGHCPS